MSAMSAQTLMDPKVYFARRRRRYGIIVLCLCVLLLTIHWLDRRGFFLIPENDRLLDGRRFTVSEIVSLNHYRLAPISNNENEIDVILMGVVPSQLDRLEWLNSRLTGRVVILKLDPWVIRDQDGRLLGYIQTKERLAGGDWKPEAVVDADYLDLGLMLLSTGMMKQDPQHFHERSRLYIQEDLKKKVK